MLEISHQSRSLLLSDKACHLASLRKADLYRGKCQVVTIRKFSTQTPFASICADAQHRDGQSNGHAPRASVWDRLGGRGMPPRVRGSQASGRSSQARGRSKVPDHVRNPHKYTVYQFDEPVTVGGGDRSAAVSGHDNDQVRQSVRRTSTCAEGLCKLSVCCCC